MLSSVTLTHHITKTRRKVMNGVENTRFPLPTLVCAEYSVITFIDICYHFCIMDLFIDNLIKASLKGVLINFRVLHYTLYYILSALMRSLSCSSGNCHSILLFKKKNQLHAVSHTQQGRKREPSVKTLCSPLSAEYWRRVRVEWQNSTLRLISTSERRNGNINLSKYFVQRS